MAHAAGPLPNTSTSQDRVVEDVDDDDEASGAARRGEDVWNDDCVLVGKVDTTAGANANACVYVVAAEATAPTTKNLIVLAGASSLLPLAP